MTLPLPFTAEAIEAIGAVSRSTRATVWLAMAVRASMRAVSSSVLTTAAEGLVEVDEAPDEAAAFFLQGTLRLGTAAAGDGDLDSVVGGGRMKEGG